MPRAWIEDGLRHAGVREQSRRVALDRRRRCQALVEHRGPAMMRALVQEIAAALHEYRCSTDDGEHPVEFEVFPRDGFLVSRAGPSSAVLQCRPDYAEQIVYCNWAHAGDRETEIVESPFNLHFTVDESGRVGVQHGARVFYDIAEIAECLLTPVLFPAGLQPASERPERCGLQVGT